MAKVLEERYGSVAQITLNRPEVRNALDMEMRLELARILKDISNSPEIRAVILTGAGEAFCAGGDVRAQGNISVFHARERLEAAYNVLRLLVTLPKPVMAAVNGTAAGVGASLVMACDIIYASEKAGFVQSFSKVGLVPDGGNIYLLTRMVGLLKAKEMILTGRMVKAPEALEIGMVNRVLPPEKLMPVTREFAAELAEGATMAYGMSKQLFLQSFHADLEDFLKVECLSQILAMQTADHQEGVNAFLGKRRPVFTGK